MSVERYIPKPVPVEAVLWDGTDERSIEIREWVERLVKGGAIVDTDHIQHLWDYGMGCYVMPRGNTIMAPFKER
jgi:hypothetical protein